MDISVDIVNLAFGSLLLSWVSIEIFRQRKDERGNRLNGAMRERTAFTKITLLSNLTLSILYMGFGLHEYWDLGIISGKCISLTITWFLATGVAVYSQRRTLREWPLVIVLWWVFSLICDTLSVSLYVVAYFRSIDWPNPLPKPSIVDFVSLPLLMLLCFNALMICCTKKENGLEQPLLLKGAEKRDENADAFTNAGFWSKIGFRWLNPLFYSGQTQKLELVHVPLVPQSETAEHASSVLEESIQKWKASSLSKAIICAIWKSLAVNAIFAGVNTIASYAGPVLITKFVNFLLGKHEGSSYNYGIFLAFVFLVSKTIESLTQRQWYFGAHRIGVRVRAALMVLVYKKSLLTKFASTSNGKITNLINVDVERIGDFFSYIHRVWLLPLQVFLALVILYWNLGFLPAIAALSSTILVMVSNTPLARMQEKFHLKIMEAKDSRVKATSETLKSMRVLKLHSWEPIFLEKLFQLREIESNWLKKYLYTCSAVAFLFWASPALVSVITFGVCILLETPLSSSTVLSTLATFQILREPIYNLPELISMIAQTKVSIDRIEEFITEDNQEWFPIHQNSAASDISIQIEKGEYAWDASNPAVRTPTIKITENIEVLKGEKIAICGPVGSGKSSLLCGILGEIPKISGAGIMAHGKKAYVAQSPWIQTGTIRENILFGKHMDRGFYEDVVEGCALNQDIHLWAEGDLSVVGERGINLSGGQKQRVQLARAVYSDSDIYILDDPFSAVDVHTGTHLFKKCLLQLLSKKTVVYATHQLEFLDAADRVLVMKDGMIIQSGKYGDLILDSDGELVRQMAAHGKSLKQVNQAHEIYTLTDKACEVSQSEVMEEEHHGKVVDNCDRCEISGKNQEEASESGRVKWSVYSTFVTSAYKGTLVPVILICHILFQGLQIGSNYWLAWATEEEQRVSREKLIGIFILLSGGSSIFILGRAVFLSTIAVKTAQRMFIGMIRSIFRAPISFFDTTPSSRILNRSSTDQSIVDTDIPYRLAGLVFALIQLFSVIILMSQIAWHVFLLFLAILGISAWYQSYYISTARELARMVGIRKAPILHHFSESIAGATTIRSFNQQDRFLAKIFSLIDDYSRVVFHNSGTMEWLCVRINFLFNFVFFVVLVILVSLPRSAIDPSLAGLAATYGLNLNVLQAWVIWNLCNVENKMISVERILQFTDTPSEAPLVIEDCRPNPDWPTEGKIELRDLHVRYSPMLPMVLRGITCTFPGGKKVGVVGRTGSGKSTLIQALFRVVEPSFGQIVVDGLNISKIGLQDLRSRLGIIPQDPTLFQGTMRHNLDPLQQHSDQEIWEVLNKCHLEEMVRQDPRLLDALVEEDGKNWSVGQRQLVCLARMLLKQRRILVLDEATSSIDTATDNVIQEALRKQTNRCTVITVAHRLATVIDNDLILVLDEGKIVEYDSPSRLLENGSSSFSKLVAESLRRSDHLEG